MRLIKFTNRVDIEDIAISPNAKTNIAESGNLKRANDNRLNLRRQQVGRPRPT
jgi:hypothetical protein